MQRLFTSSQHDRIVDQVARELFYKGFDDIRADLVGWRQPEVIRWNSTSRGHVPDVTACDRGGVLHVFEVETADSIGVGHTDDQWQLFAALANQRDAVFYVVVPVGYGARVRFRLALLRLTARVIEW